MSHDLSRAMSPEEQELAAKRAELADYSELLAEKELQLKELKLCLARFENRYFRQVGSKYVELDDLRARIEEARSRKCPGDACARRTAKAAREKAERTASEHKGVPESSENTGTESPASEDIKRLYRRIASLIHPDKSTDAKSRDIRTRLMAQLNSAYSKRDMRQMMEILSEWESSPETVTAEDTAAELVRVIRAIAQVRRRVSQIEKEITQLGASDMYKLMTEVHQADEHGRDVLKEMAQVVQRQIDKAQEELARNH